VVKNKEAINKPSDYPFAINADAQEDPQADEDH
jgi:hypothetical protein